MMRLVTTILCGLILIGTMSVPALAGEKEVDLFYKEAKVLYNEGKFKEALPVFIKAYNESKMPKIKNKTKVKVTSFLVAVYYRLGDLDKALALSKENIETLKNKNGSDTPQMGKTYNNLGELYFAKGDLDSAEATFLKAIPLISQLKDSASVLEVSYVNLAELYRSKQDFEKAGSYFDKALKESDKLADSDDIVHKRSRASLFSNYGQLWHDQNKLEKAEAYYKKALALFESDSNLLHPDMAVVYSNLAVINRHKGKLYLAKLYNEKSLQINLEAFGENHKETITDYNNLSVVYESLGDYPTALNYLNKALSSARKSYPARHPLVVAIENNMKDFKEDHKE